MNLILIAILGLCYGSFINVLIYRLPSSISIISPRSYCPKCKTSIPIYRNIPLLSYIIQTGKCHSCKNNISFQYPAIEFITSISWICFYMIINDNISSLIFSITVVSFLIPLAMIDYKYMFFPLSLILPLICTSIGFSFIEFYYFDNLEPLYGGVVSVAFLSFVYLIVKLWFKHKNIEKQPMGFGDILLIIPLGVWLGPLGILISIFLASLIALLIWMILNSLTSFKIDNKMPFGPYLVISAIFTKILIITHLIDVIFQIG